MSQQTSEHLRIPRICPVLHPVRERLRAVPKGKRVVKIIPVTVGYCVHGLGFVVTRGRK
jgi:hypothetical protein